MNTTLNQQKLTSIKEIPLKRVWKNNINIPSELLGQFNIKLKKVVVKNILKFNKYLNNAEILIMISKLIVSVSILFHKDIVKEKNEFKSEVESLDKDASNIFTRCSEETIKKFYSVSLGSDEFKNDRVDNNKDFEYHQIIDNILNETIISKHGDSKDCFCITYDLLRQCHSIFPILVNIFESIINNNKDPDECFAIIAKCKLIPKVKNKYTEMDWANKRIELTRPITSCPVIFRILDIYMSRQLKKYYIDKGLINMSQMVLRPNGLLNANHNVINYIRTIKDNTEKAILFKDIKDAYSAVMHGKLITIMINDGVPDYIINYYNNFLNNLNLYVKNPNDVFRMYNGILQGQNSSQILFIIYMGSYIKDIKNLMANCMNNSKYQNRTFLIAYVDDLVFKISSLIFLKKLFHVLPLVNTKFNFKFGLSKSKKIMDTKTYCDNDFNYNGYLIEDVPIDMKYLGGYVYPDSDKLLNYLTRLIVTDNISLIRTKSVNRIHSLAMVNKHIINSIIQKFSKSNIELGIIQLNKIMFEIGLFLYELDFEKQVTVCFSIKMILGFWKKYTSTGIYKLSDEKQKIVNSILKLDDNSYILDTSKKLCSKIQHIIMSKSAYGKTFAYDAIF